MLAMQCILVIIYVLYIHTFFSVHGIVVYRFVPPVAMEVRGLVGSVDANGIVQFSSGGQIVSKEDPTLKQLYGSNGDNMPQAVSTAVAAPADAVGLVPGEIAWQEPWRGQVDAAARDTIAEIEDRGDIDLDICPIYEDLKKLRMRLRTEEVVDQDQALELIKGGRMFLFLCEWDDSES